MNRLQLNWELASAKERAEFLSQYIEKLPFKPTPTELETCAAYILWGFDEDGQNGEQKGQYDLGRKHDSWTKKQPASLEEILASSGETEILPNSHVPTKAPREVFSREKTRKEAPSSLLPIFENLWKDIDILDLALCEYERSIGKRSTPPRAELVSRLTSAQIQTAQKKASSFSNFSYLKERHHLIELRRQQYTLRDSYALPPQRSTSPPQINDTSPPLPIEIEIQPLQYAPCFFINFEKLVPNNFKQEDLQLLTKLLWEKKDPEATFDFRKESNLNEFLEHHEDFQGTLLYQIFNYYVNEAGLTDSQKDLLSRKLRGETNTCIAAALNETYGSNYTDNYISTIYRKKIIPQIAQTARIHRDLLENLFFPENWKICTGCGRTLLRNNDFFVKKSRASDGLAGRCKSCDKRDRLRKYKHNH